uniref:Uncharacterized protein n=1 Tax=Myotis myotis TaxID=51298 RepID=A0A7J7UCR7_MYOMY|nr:hypothetical protein mMyoMyo1_008777 [Myotis myotis]
MVTVRARSLLAISIFHTNFPRGLGGERAGLSSPLELGEGRIQGEKVTLINQPVRFCMPPPAPTTSLIRTCCALSTARVPNAALKPILRGVLTAMAHHCLPSPALVLTRHGRHLLCPISAYWAGVGGGGGVWGPRAEEAPSPSKGATAKCSLSLGLAFPAGTRRRWSVAQKGAPVLV